MSRVTKITNLRSLKLAQSELKNDLLQSELRLHNQVTVLKESLFSLKKSSKNADGLFKLFDLKPTTLAKLISGFFVTKILKPKSKLMRKATTLLSTFLIQKYSGTLQKSLAKLIAKDDKAKLDE